MRTWLLIALALIISCFCTAGLQAQNLLTNPGFESLASGLNYTDGIWMLDSWRYFSVNGAGGTFQTVNDAHTGSIAVKLTRTSTSGDTGLDRDDPALRIPVVPNHAYTGSVWAKTTTGGSLLLVIAPYDSNGQWMKTQKQQAFALTQNYTQVQMTYAPPPGAASVNFALRVNGTGTITVDDCSLTDIGGPPPPPTITYPDNETVDSFKPAIAFAGSPHTGYQAIIQNNGATVWDSGTVTSAAFSLNCPVTLQKSTSYQVKVRLQNAAGWGDYCQPVDFTTPAGPLVRITAPMEADSIRGPSATIKWQVESTSSVTQQRITVDNKAPVTLSNSARSYNLSNLTQGVHSVSISVTTADGTVQDTSRFYVRITPSASVNTIYFYDLSYTLNYNRNDPYQLGLSYDIPMAVVALQGLVNRKGPRLFIKMSSADDTWFSRMRASGNWLNGKTVITIPTGFSNLATLFDIFSDDYKGAVLWDPNVYATSNVATTVAGADDLIPIRYDPTPGSVYSILVASGFIPVQIDLRNRFTGTGTIWDTGLPSTGSKKCDAYVWARSKYLETGKSNPNLLFYGIDAYSMVNNHGGAQSSMLANRDYIVQNKGFAFDLNVWGDERPIDDPTQPLGTDLNTLRSIGHAAVTRASGMIELIGFVPWPVKYTNWPGAGGTKHDPVPSEWEQVRLCSHYNIYVDADAVAHNMEMANASIYCQFPLPDRLTQNRKYSQTELRKLGYIDKNNNISPLNYLNFYIGDYDSGSWITRYGNDNWNDSARGTVPMSWAFNPNLIKRIAGVYEYYNRTRTDKDFFIAGDSGAGYVNPSCLIGNRISGLPSAYDLWINHNLDYFRRTNVKITGFIINGTAGSISSTVDGMYAKFSTEGTFSQRGWYPQGDHLYGSMPALLQQRDLEWDVTPSVDIIEPYGVHSGIKFLNFRSIIRTPSWVKSVFDGVVAKDNTKAWALVDAATYASLARRHMGSTPECRATYTFDTAPSTIYAGLDLPYSIGVRNDGWTRWNASGSGKITLLFKWIKGSTIVKSTVVTLPRDVESGSGIVLDLVCAAPAEPGEYILRYEMARDGIPFSSLGDYAWEKKVTTVAAGETTCSKAKTQPNGASVIIADAIVTAGTDQLQHKFYLQDQNELSGIQVYTSSSSSITARVGDRISLTGTMSTADGERRIINPVILLRVPAAEQ